LWKESDALDQSEQIVSAGLSCLGRLDGADRALAVRLDDERAPSHHGAAVQRLAHALSRGLVDPRPIQQLDTARPPVPTQPLEIERDRQGARAVREVAPVRIREELVTIRRLLASRAERPPEISVDV
jgi:hypothetical protein